MLDVDLPKLYDVETYRLNEQVKCNKACSGSLKNQNSIPIEGIANLQDPS